MLTAESLAPPAVSGHAALQITEADAFVMYGDLSPYRIELRLDADGWHVSYRLREKRVARGEPHYIIDAQTGAILSKKYYQ